MSNDGMVVLINSLSSTMGIERKLTKAARQLQEGLSAYIAMTDKMAASIDRILTKSELIISR